MGKIFCLMGKSSSGKDTLYRKILEEEGSKLKKIVPYTTRPIRQGETEGVEYHFTDEAGLERLAQQGRVIELRAYDTVCGVWKYFTVNDAQIDLERDNYLVIGTLESFLKIREFFGAEKVCPIYVEVEDGLRVERALMRERMQTAPKYEEMCRRFLADAQDFSQEKLEEAGITTRFMNESLDETARRIIQYIEGNE